MTQTKVTNAELVVLAGIVRGIVGWSDICRNYFGIARYKGLGGRNAVHQKLVALKGKELVSKDGSKYSLTTAGQEALDAYDGDVHALQSDARKNFESENPEATQSLAEEQAAFDAKFAIPSDDTDETVAAATEVAEGAEELETSEA